MVKTNSFVKRITSLFLSLVFVLTTFAAVDFSQSGAVTAEASNREYFLFSYFTGNDSASSSSAYSQAIRFAVSEDGINFTALNDNKPIITQTGGSRSVRDPYLFQGADGYYYMIGTDLDAATMGWWGNQPQMVIWRSEDLVHWDHETYINTAQICGLNNDQVYRTWAPEVFYDEATGKYMVYFAFAADGYSSTRMHYMLTDDLLDQSHYSRPQVLYDPGYDDIDSDIIKQGDTYYMFYKDETPGRSSVCLATASALTGPYTFIGQFKTSSATGAIEGCEVYTIGNNYYLVADRFGDNGKFAIYNLGSDLSAVAAASNNENISVEDGNPVSTVNGLTGFQNLSARHGSIIHITKKQYNRLLDFGGADEAIGEGVDLTDITLARYLVNDETTDEIGSNNLTEQGNPTWENNAFRDRERGAAHFTDGNYLSANVASMLSSNGVASNGFSVSFYGKPDSNNNNQFGRFFELNDKGIKSSFSWNGNPGQNSVSYVSMWPYESKIEITNYNYEARSWSVQSGITNNYYNSWHHYVATFENGKYCLYVDGVSAYQTESASMSSNLLNDLCSNGTLLLGQAGWPDAGYTGYMRDFRIYSTALTEAQATKVYRQYALDEEAEDAQAIQDLIDNFDVNNLNKPAFNGTAYHYGNAATGGYTNGTVVYHATNNTDYSNEQDRAYMKLHFYAPKNLVLAYDGTKTLTYPVVFGQKRDGSHSQRIYNVALVAGTNQALNQNWKGYSDVNNGYSNTNSPWPGVTGATEINYVNDSSSYIEPNNNNTPRVYGNYITYTGKVNNNNDGSVNTNANFYEKLNSITFRYKGYYSYFGSNTQTLDVTLTGYSVYILNYKPIYDILDDAKAFYNNNITGKEWMYTTESLTQAIKALSLVANCNPNNYNYSSGVEAEVQKCAADIKTALDEYESINLVKKTFNVNFIFDDGAVTSRTITAGDTLGALPENSAAKHIEGTSTHNGYSWPAEATADTVVRDDTDFEEVATINACSFTDEAHTAASGNTNGYTTYTCVCGNSYIEYDAQTKWSEYNDAIDGYDAIIGAEDYETKYTAASRADYEAEVATLFIDVYDETLSDAAILAAAQAIEAAISNLDEVADLKDFDIAFRRANDFLIGLDGKAAQYDAASVQALIDALAESGEKTGISAATIFDADAATRLSYGQDVQSDATKLANGINTAFDGLTITPIVAPEEAIDAYAEAVNKLNNIDPDIYQENDEHSLQTAVTTVNEIVSTSDITYENSTIYVVNNAVTMQDADDATSAILNALSNCIKMYTIKADSKEVEISANSGTYYAPKASYGAKINFVSDNDDTAWYMKYKTTTTERNVQFQGSGKLYSANVIGDMDVHVEMRSDDTPHKVSIQRDYQNGKYPIQSIHYAGNNEIFTLPEAPAILNYEFVGYYIGDSKINGNTIEVTGDIAIAARYKSVESDGYNVVVKSTSGDYLVNESAQYNTKISVSDENAYAWVEKIVGSDNYRPFSFNNKLDFFVTESTEIVAVTEPEFNAYGFSLPVNNIKQSDAKVEIVDTTTNKKKVFFNGQIVNDKIESNTILEYGFLVGTTINATPSEKDLVLENSGVHTDYRIIRAKSTKLVGANQFTIAINGLSGTIRYRGYVTYQNKDGQIKTVYTDSVTQDI